MTAAPAAPAAPVELNRTWVMHRAWYYVRVWRTPASPFRLRQALRYAWSDLRAKMRGLRLTSELTGNELALAALENKNFTTPEERERMGNLRSAIGHERAAVEYAAKRALIEAAPCVVTFTKADGSARVMRVEPGKLVAKGERATKPGQRGVKARKARHPNLLPVWDAEAQAPRSVNLATVSRIATAQGVHTFAG